MTCQTDLLQTLTHNKLPLEFYLNDVESVAKNLLGKILIKTEGNSFLYGKIVEVEAYSYSGDLASHSACGKTNRNSAMFEQGGILYVYNIYGIHCCLNVVTGSKDIGDAVLIRALEPKNCFKLLAENRFNKSNITCREFVALTNGPAKICKAFNITTEHNFTNLCQNEIFVAYDFENSTFEIAKSTRIGITKSVELERRYYIKDNPFISRK